MSVKGCSADTDDFGDCLHRVLAAGVHLAGDSEFAGCECGWSATDASSGSCCGEPGHGAVANEVAFELGDSAEDVEDELAAGGRSVDVLGERPEPDIAFSERGHGLDEMA